MSNKLSPKRVTQLCQKIALLSDIMVDTIDELYTQGEGGQALKVSLEVAKSRCEGLVSKVFEVQEIRSSMYFNDLSVKIDTLIRNHFKNI